MTSWHVVHFLRVCDRRLDRDRRHSDVRVLGDAGGNDNFDFDLDCSCCPLCVAVISALNTKLERMDKEARGCRLWTSSTAQKWRYDYLA